MTAPGDYTDIVSRGDTAALMPEQVSGSMGGGGRRHAAARASVGGDGKVAVRGRHVGTVSRSPGGLAWRARAKGGQMIGLHASKTEAVGALVQHHEKGSTES